MQFFEEMKDKWGFSDGEAMPDGVGEYREVYLRAINAFAERHGSLQRMIAWNRPGVHNGCLVLGVTREYFDSLKSDGERYVSGPADHPREEDMPRGRDAGLQCAIGEAMEADLDQYVNVAVTVAKDRLHEMLHPAPEREASENPDRSGNGRGEGISGELKKSITDTLLANAESFLDDHGVDRKVCDQVAGEILDHLLRQKIRVMVAVRGGCVQGALADLPSITLALYDYDVFETEAKDDSDRTADQAEKEWADAQASMHAIF